MTDTSLTCDFDMLTLQKMKFIYNAIQDGWIVRKIDDKKIEFKRDNDNVVKEYILDDYLKNFITDNLTGKVF